MDELADYDYHLPPERIAERPAARRDAARLMVVRRHSGECDHRGIRDLPELLRAGDRLVLNDTRVVPARLFGTRAATGGKWEGLFLGTTPEGAWRLLCQTRGKLRTGERITLVPAGLPSRTADDAALSTATTPGEATRTLPTSRTDFSPSGKASGSPATSPCALLLAAHEGEGIWRAVPEVPADPLAVLEQFGTVPLPPYIRRPADAEDRLRYQTTYARIPGAVAAPTAGLHFTPELLAACAERDIRPVWVTLHVGIGTFRPITVERLERHAMHAEWCTVSERAAAELNAARRDGGRIVAVGTTSVRTLESATDAQGTIHPRRGETNLFIRPPYRFRAVDVLLTNFHLPRSTLLVLVSAFAGRETILRAYESAIRKDYRFYSYGDAMLIL